MKRIFYGVLLAITLSFVLMNMGAITKGAPLFCLRLFRKHAARYSCQRWIYRLADKKCSVGRHYFFRPVVFDAELISHRVIGEGKTGFITKGDNSPVTDQAAGEPELTYDRIVGKVVTVNHVPLILPGFGNIIMKVNKIIGTQDRFIGGFLIASGITLALWDSWFPHKYKRKTRRRWRLRDLYRLLAIAVVGIVVFGVLIGSRVHQVSYMVSESPGTVGNHVHMNKPDQIDMLIKNCSLIPVWQFASGIAPFVISENLQIIAPRSETKITIEVPPQQEVGWKNGYIRIYHYPLVMPGFFLKVLHRTSQNLALVAVALSFSFLLWLFFNLLNRVEGLEGWIPLRAFKDKISERRWRHLKAKYWKKRRSSDK